MVLTAADSFCDCVTFGILGTFQRNARSLRVGAGCCLIVVVVEEEIERKEIALRGLFAFLSPLSLFLFYLV